MTTHNTFYISRNKTKIDQTEVELYLEKTVLVPKLFANYTEVADSKKRTGAILVHRCAETSSTP